MVRDQPIGMEVRYVRYLKCRKWGRMNTDKVCPLFDNSVTVSPPTTGGRDAGNLMKQMKEEGLANTHKVLSRRNAPMAAIQQMPDSEGEDAEEV